MAELLLLLLCTIQDSCAKCLHAHRHDQAIDGTAPGDRRIIGVKWIWARVSTGAFAVRRVPCIMVLHAIGEFAGSGLLGK